jgi:hypothetical protein
VGLRSVTSDELEFPSGHVTPGLHVRGAQVNSEPSALATSDGQPYWWITKQVGTGDVGVLW